MAAQRLAHGRLACRSATPQSSAAHPKAVSRIAACRLGPSRHGRQQAPHARRRAIAPQAYAPRQRPFRVSSRCAMAASKRPRPPSNHRAVALSASPVTMRLDPPSSVRPAAPRPLRALARARAPHDRRSAKRVEPLASLSLFSPRSASASPCDAYPVNASAMVLRATPMAAQRTARARPACRGHVASIRHAVASAGLAYGLCGSVRPRLAQDRAARSVAPRASATRPRPSRLSRACRLDPPRHGPQRPRQRPGASIGCRRVRSEASANTIPRNPSVSACLK
jgi:hypothetical protein